MKKYELMPVDGRKSFGHKAVVEVDEHGTKTLYSYGTPIIRRPQFAEVSTIPCENVIIAEKLYT